MNKKINEIKMLFENNYSVVVDGVWENDDMIWVSYTHPTEKNRFGNNKHYMANVVWYEDTEDENNSGWKIKEVFYEPFFGMKTEVVME